MNVFIRYITGFSAIPQYMRFDILNNVYEDFNFVQRADCAVCGEHGIEGKGVVLPDGLKSCKEGVI